MASHATGEQLAVVVGAVHHAVDIDFAFEYDDSTSDVTGSPQGQGVGSKEAPGGGEGGAEVGPTQSSSTTTTTNTTRTVMGLGSFLRAPVPTSTAASPSTGKALPSSFGLESKVKGSTGGEASAAIRDTGGGGSMLVRTLRHKLSLSAPKRHPADVLVSHLTWKAVYCAHSGVQRSLKGTQLCVTMTILVGFLLFMMNLQVSVWGVGDGGGVVARARRSEMWVVAGSCW